jgi:thiamine biosynthesis lipoprotein
LKLETRNQKLFSPSPTGRNRYYAWFGALHTRVDLLFYGPYPEEKFLEVEESVRQRLAEIEQMGNRFDPQSELSQAVRQAHERPVPLSPELFTLLTRCREARLQTGGLFDITVNSPAFKPGLAQSVELTADGCLRLHTADVVLDLSGILKGYALEQLRMLLTTKGIADAVVNLGNSSIMALGDVPLDIPSGHCLTTSGNATATRRHIRNPLTGAFIEGVSLAKVITANAIDGEIQSIASFIQTAEMKEKQTGPTNFF